MATPEEIVKHLAEPFAAELIEDKNGQDYIPAEFIRDRVNQATENQYDWRHISIDFRTSDGVLKPHRETGEIAPICVYIGELTIPELGTRIGIGVQEMQAGSGADAAYKGAESDAFKRAAMAFGVALKQLYMDNHKFNANPRRAAIARREDDAPREVRVYTDKGEETVDVSHATTGSLKERVQSGRGEWVPDASDQNAQVRSDPVLTGGLTEPQFRNLQRLLKKVEWPREDAKAYMTEKYGVDSTTKLDKAKASDFIQFLKIEAGEPVDDKRR
jgi:hypothetical protein